MMKKKMIVLMSLFWVFVLLVGIVTAADDQTGIPTKIVVSDMFTWLYTSPPNFVVGAIYLILGFIGALAAIFGLVGDAIPGTNGKALLEVRSKRLEAEEQVLDLMIKDPNVKPEKLTAINDAVNTIRDDLNQDKRRQFNQAAIIYLILGAFFAAMLATNMLQAIVIGFGWTAVIGVLGLNSDNSYRKSQKDEAIDDLEKEKAELVKNQDVLQKRIDELSKIVAAHNPELGSVRTEADLALNKSVKGIVENIKSHSDSMCLAPTITENEKVNKRAMARLM
jgi:hypothetical protein